VGTVCVYLILTKKRTDKIKHFINLKSSLFKDITDTAATIKKNSESSQNAESTLIMCSENFNEPLESKNGDSQKSSMGSSISAQKKRIESSVFDAAALEGKYKVISEISGGGMSRVFLVENVKLGNQWILKFIPTWLGKLANEFKILKMLNHPGLPSIIDVFIDELGIYMIESYIDGVSLSALLSVEGKINQVLVQDWAEQIAQILDYLHSRNISHLDLKPSNVMVTFGNRLVLIDFGISKHSELPSKDQTAITFRYAAPEQLPEKIPEEYESLIRSRFGVLAKNGSKATDTRTDIYSLGVILFKMLTGHVPTVNNMGMIKGIISNELSSIISKCLAINPDDRFQSSKELLEMLRKADGAAYKTVGTLAWRKAATVAMPIFLLTSVFTFMYAHDLYFNITVNPVPIRATISLRDTYVMKLAKTTSNGDVRPLDFDSIRWEFSDSGIVAIEGARILGLNLGETTISGQYRNEEFELTVNVIPQPENLVRISQFFLRDSKASVMAGNGILDHIDGNLENASFMFPESISLANDGTIYMVDNSHLRRISNGIISTVERDKPHFSADLVRCFEDDVYLLIAPFEDIGGNIVYGILKLGDPLNMYIADARYTSISDFLISDDGVMYFIENNMATGQTHLKSMELGDWENHTVLAEGLPADSGSLALADDGTVFFTSPQTGMIQMYRNGNISVFAGSSDYRDFVDGYAPLFFMPLRLKYAEGALYVWDFNTLRRVEMNGGVAYRTSTIFGIASPTYSEKLPNYPIPVYEATIPFSRSADFIATQNEIILTDPLRGAVWIIDR